MNKKELDFILQEGEGYKIEFKESLNNLDKEIVALANAEGGRIFLGISDDNKVKGIKIDNKLKSQIQDIANNCDPAVKVGFEEFVKCSIQVQAAQVEGNLSLFVYSQSQTYIA